MWDWLLWWVIGPVLNLFSRALETFYPNEAGWYGWAWIKLGLAVILVVVVIVLFIVR
jgi:hypothetical protein